MKKIAVLLAILISAALFAQTKVGKIIKTDAQWKKELSPEVYQSLRKKATERPNTGKYTENYKKGTYVCAACNLEIFSSVNKYHSGTGWPAFDRSIKGSVLLVPDKSLNMERTEVVCARCNGHLGHRFDDGPLDTTGKRFCINSVAMKFIPTK